MCVWSGKDHTTSKCSQVFRGVTGTARKQREIFVQLAYGRTGRWEPWTREAEEPSNQQEMRREEQSNCE